MKMFMITNFNIGLIICNYKNLYMLWGYNKIVIIEQSFWTLIKNDCRNTYNAE